MRFFLTPAAARFFHRHFLHPARGSYRYRELVRDSWRGDTSQLDLTETGENQKFAAWLIRELRRRSRGNHFGSHFRKLADQIEEFQNRSAIDRLGDLVDQERTQVKVEGASKPSARERAIRKRLLARVGWKHEPTRAGGRTLKPDAGERLQDASAPTEPSETEDEEDQGSAC